jgi:tetratricopeptide (TPR) repeat protein
LLDELAEARLLDVERPARGQPARYHFHDLIRVFAAEQTDNDGDEQSRHAVQRVFGCLLAVANEAYMRAYRGNYALLRGVAPRWEGTGPYFDQMLRDPMGWFDAERFNLRAAVSQAASLGMDELSWELAVNSVALYEARGLFDDWRDTHMTALEATRRAGNRRGEAAILASLGSLGVAQHSKDDMDMLLGALALFDEMGDQGGRALALRNLAHLDRIQGRPERAMERYEQALDGFRAAGDRGAQAHILSGLARTYLDLGLPDGAETFAKESLALGQELGSRRLQAQALVRLGEVFAQAAQLLAAKAVFQEALDLTRLLGDHVGEAYALTGLGSAAVELGELDTAEIHYSQAVEICRTVNERNVYAHALFGLGRVYGERQEHDRAEHYYVRAANAFAAQENGSWHTLARDALHAVREAAARLAVSDG